MARIEYVATGNEENRLGHRLSLLTTRGAWIGMHQAAAAVGLKPQEWVRALIADELRRLSGEPMRVSPLGEAEIEEILAVGRIPRRRNIPPEAMYALRKGRKGSPFEGGPTIPPAASPHAPATHAATDPADAALSHPTAPSVNHSTSV